MQTVALNIETVKDPDSPVDLSRTITVPSNYKNEEKILAYIQERKKELDEAAGLHPLTGKIICLCAIDVNTYEEHIIFDESERDLLRRAREELFNDYDTTIIGFNSISFDIPYLFISAMRHGIDLRINYSSYLKPFVTSRHIDIFRLLSVGEKRLGKLREWADRFGVTPPYRDGAEIQTLYDSKQYDEIVKHCLSNVHTTAQIYKRMAPVIESIYTS